MRLLGFVIFDLVSIRNLNKGLGEPSLKGSALGLLVVIDEFDQTPSMA
jgi:hypothetical protein